MAMHCHLSSNLETCAPNEPQMTVDTTRWKVHQIYPTPSQPWVPNFNPFQEKCREWSQNDLNCNMHGVTSKWPWTHDANGTPYMLYQCPRIPNFKRFWRFLVTGHFKTSVPNDPKWPWPQLSQGTPRMLYQYPRVSNFNPFLSTVSSFRLAGYVGTSVANDRKMTHKDTGTLLYVLLQVPPRSKFHSAVLYARPCAE